MSSSAAAPETYSTPAAAPVSDLAGHSTSNNNASSSSNGNNSNKTPLRADELSRRMFLGGLLGLPWLWIVHTLYWYGKQRGIDDGRQLYDSTQSDDPTRREQSQILLTERLWVKRCRNSAVFVTAVWIVWILLVQVILTQYFPDSWFVAKDDTGESTGW